MDALLSYSLDRNLVILLLLGRLFLDGLGVDQEGLPRVQLGDALHSESFQLFSLLGRLNFFADLGASIYVLLVEERLSLGVIILALVLFAIALGRLVRALLGELRRVELGGTGAWLCSSLGT